MRYYNEQTKEWYTEGTCITRRIDESTVFSGVPSVELLLSWGFVQYIDPEPTPAEELERAKQEKLAEIEEYDTSENVNSFELRMNGEKVIDYWIARDLRTSLEGDVRAAKEVGDTYNFDIRELGTTLTLDCDKFLAALDRLRRYAYTAYNVTSAHMAAVRALDTIAAVEAYDNETGYPVRLVFNIEDLQ